MMSLNPFGRNHPNLNEELQTLTEKMEPLRSKADDIQCQLRNEELQSSKKRKSEVTVWLKRVEEIKQDFESIKAEILVVENIDGRKSKALLNKMKGMVEGIDQLLTQGEFSQGLVLDDLKLEGIELVTTNLEGSAPLTVQDEVWGAFRRGESRVGIYGMGGVGKTTVAMHLNNEILSGCRDHFKHVFYVTVSRGTTVHKLQQDISIALTLTLSNDDEARRAAELRMSLKKRTKSLLILDDIWADIPMEKVGVAAEGDGCKLFITTRKRDVCRKMSCDTIVEMKPLPEKEAWDLFVNKLGNYELLNDAVKGVARSIAEECAGLPLAIITMATCLRKEFSENVWRDMLRELQNPSRNQDDMDDKVFNILKSSYERLSNDKLRECLLNCALYMENHKNLRDTLINRLIAVSPPRGEGTRKENIDKGHQMLQALADASLLECTTDYLGRGQVKMHDLIRDMAVKIIGRQGIVKPSMFLKEMPRKEEWTKDLVRVSLMSNYITDIGDEICPECPDLSVLILRGNRFWNIPHSFFVHMEGLRCLDLSSTSIYKLPNSIANLCNLNALLVYDCRWLHSIPSLAGLTKLKDLNLSGTKLKELPVGVEELINLQYLDITETKIQSMPEGLLGKLCKLESLLSNYNINIEAKKLTSLRQLFSFEGSIDDFDAFKQFVCSDWFDRLERYSINVRDPTKYNIPIVVDKYCATATARRIIIHHLSIRKEVGFKVPHTVQILELKSCSFGVDCLLDVLPSLCGAFELEEISLDECKGIKYIISNPWFERGECEVKEVQRLRLDYLDEFVGLYEGEAVHPHIFFSGLRELRISGCPNVNKILLQNAVLPNLESIEVSNCENVEEVFATTGGAAIELPCLNSITLDELSKLKNICGSNVFLPCLEKVDVCRCPNLEQLWLVKEELPCLVEVSVAYCDQMKEIFAKPEETTAEFPKLCSLILQCLPELKRICRNGFVFTKLEYLHLRECPKLKKIGLLNHNMPFLWGIHVEQCREIEEIFENAIQVPNLERIFLLHMPELRSICGEAIVCDSLKSVTVEGKDKLGNCPISMPRLSLANINPRFPTLEARDKPEDWWNSLYWNDPATKLAFDRFRCLKVHKRIPETSSSFMGLESSCSSSDHQPDYDSDSDIYYSCTAFSPFMH